MRIRSSLAVPICVGLALALAGCSGDNSTTVSGAVTPSHPGSVSTTVPSTGETATRPSTDSQVLQFEAPAVVSCAGATANVTLTYVTVNLTAVGFVVDGQPATGATAPPTSGEYSVALPCDGNAHTVQLVGSGPSGPAFAAKAVVTRST